MWSPWALHASKPTKSAVNRIFAMRLYVPSVRAHGAPYGLLAPHRASWDHIRVPTLFHTGPAWRPRKLHWAPSGIHQGATERAGTPVAPQGACGLYFMTGLNWRRTLAKWLVSEAGQPVRPTKRLTRRLAGLVAL